MASPEIREFTPAQLDGPKNAMGYPEVPYTLHSLEHKYVPKDSSNDTGVSKPNQPRKTPK